MIFRIIIVLFNLFFALNLLAVNQITYISNNDFKKFKIFNGKIVYSKNLGYPGYGIRFDFKKEFITENTDLFLDFEKKEIKYDKTKNYKLKYYSLKIDPDRKYKGSLVGGFRKPGSKIIIDVNKNDYLSNFIDLKNISIDFYLFLVGYHTKNIILKKGIYYDDKFYGIIFKIENKNMVIRLNNLFYDMEQQTYSFKIKSNRIIELNQWYHIGFIFNRSNGRLLLYVNGELDGEKHATLEQTSNSEILTPKFNKFDGSDLVLFENFLGYADNFRISRSANIDFKKYIDARFNEMSIYSPLFDFKYINSQISNISFKVKDYDKGIMKISSKYGNRLSDIDSMDWVENKVLSPEGDLLLMDNFKPLCKYYKWKMVLQRNPVEKDNAIFYYFNMNYKENPPPLPPNDIRILKSNDIIKLAWTTNLEHDLQGYLVFWGRKSKNYENKVDVGLKNNYILDFLELNKNYYFSVKAYDSKDIYHLDKFSERLITIQTQYNLSKFSKEVHILTK